MPGEPRLVNLRRSGPNGLDIFHELHEKFRKSGPNHFVKFPANFIKIVRNTFRTDKCVERRGVEVRVVEARCESVSSECRLCVSRGGHGFGVSRCELVSWSCLVLLVVWRSGGAW